MTRRCVEVSYDWVEGMNVYLVGGGGEGGKREGRKEGRKGKFSKRRGEKARARGLREERGKGSRDGAGFTSDKSCSAPEKIEGRGGVSQEQHTLWILRMCHVVVAWSLARPGGARELCCKQRGPCEAWGLAKTCVAAAHHPRAYTPYSTHGQRQMERRTNTDTNTGSKHILRRSSRSGAGP